MRRTHCELSSRMDLTDACHSAAVGWTLPVTSIARETSACGPGLGPFQSIDQRTHAKSPPRSPNCAVRHADPSMRTSTDFNDEGPPHAAPLILYTYPPFLSVRRVTRAITYLRRVWEIEVSRYVRDSSVWGTRLVG